MIQEIKQRIELLPKQMKLMESNVPEVLYSGAFGAGKSRGLCYKALTHARIPGNFIGLCRKTLASLKQTTLRVLLKPDGHLPPVLPPGTYTHNKSESLISLHDGGDIYYFGFDDPFKVASLNLGWIGIDEGIEIEEDEYTMVLGRLRNTADPNRQVVTVTNPGAPTHFLHKRFFGKPDPKRQLIETTSEENYLLPEDYLERLRGFTGQYYDRFVLGKWITFEGLIYDNFRREIHLVKHDISEFRYFIIGVDEGYIDPAVLSLWGVDNDGRIHLVDLFYQTHVLEKDVVKFAIKFGHEHNVELDRIFVVDKSAAGLIAALDDAGLNVEQSDSDITTGIQETRNRFDVAEDNKPRITFDPRCNNIGEALTEIDSYHRGKDEKPAKGLMDHFMDTMRYVSMHLRNQSTPHLHVIDLDEKPKRKPIKPEDRHGEFPMSKTDHDDVSVEHIMESEKAWD